MKCYIRFNSDYLEDAEFCESVKAARDYFQSVAAELNGFGQSVEATIHVYDRSVEDSPRCQEYPDYILGIGPRGGIRMERT